MADDLFSIDTTEFDNTLREIASRKRSETPLMPTSKGIGMPEVPRNIALESAFVPSPVVAPPQEERGFLGQAAHDIWTGVKQGVFSEADTLDNIINVLAGTTGKDRQEVASALVNDVISRPTEKDVHEGLKSMVFRGMGQAVPIILEFIAGTKGVGAAMGAAKLPTAVKVGARIGAKPAVELAEIAGRPAAKQALQMMGEPVMTEAVKGARWLKPGMAGELTKQGTKGIIGLGAPTYFGVREAGTSLAEDLVKEESLLPSLGRAAVAGGKGVAVGTALGASHMLPGGLATRMPAMGGIFAGQTALEPEATGQDILASGIVGSLLAAPELVGKGIEVGKKLRSKAPHQGPITPKVKITTDAGDTLEVDPAVIDGLRTAVQKKYGLTGDMSNLDVATLQRMLAGTVVPKGWKGAKQAESVEAPTAGNVAQQQQQASQNDQAKAAASKAAADSGKVKAKDFEDEIGQLKKDIITICKADGFPEDEAGFYVLEADQFQKLAALKNIDVANPEVMSETYKIVMEPGKGKKPLKIRIRPGEDQGLGRELDIDKLGLSEPKVDVTINEQGEPDIRINESAKEGVEIAPAKQLANMKKELADMEVAYNDPNTPTDRKTTALTVIKVLREDIAKAERAAPAPMAPTGNPEMDTAFKQTLGQGVPTQLDTRKAMEIGATYTKKEAASDLKLLKKIQKDIIKARDEIGKQKEKLTGGKAGLGKVAEEGRRELIDNKRKSVTTKLSNLVTKEQAIVEKLQGYLGFRPGEALPKDYKPEDLEDAVRFVMAREAGKQSGKAPEIKPVVDQSNIAELVDMAQANLEDAKSRMIMLKRALTNPTLDPGKRAEIQQELVATQKITVEAYNELQEVLGGKTIAKGKSLNEDIVAWRAATKEADAFEKETNRATNRAREAMARPIKAGPEEKVVTTEEDLRAAGIDPESDEGIAILKGTVGAEAVNPEAIKKQIEAGKVQEKAAEFQARDTARKLGFKFLGELGPILAFKKVVKRASIPKEAKVGEEPEVERTEAGRPVVVEEGQWLGVSKVTGEWEIRDLRTGSTLNVGANIQEMTAKLGRTPKPATAFEKAATEVRSTRLLGDAKTAGAYFNSASQAARLAGELNRKGRKYGRTYTVVSRDIPAGGYREKPTVGYYVEETITGSKGDVALDQILHGKEKTGKSTATIAIESPYGTITMEADARTAATLAKILGGQVTDVPKAEALVQPVTESKPATMSREERNAAAKAKAIKAGAGSYIAEVDQLDMGHWTSTGRGLGSIGPIPPQAALKPVKIRVPIQKGGAVGTEKPLSKTGQKALDVITGKKGTVGAEEVDPEAILRQIAEGERQKKEEAERILAASPEGIAKIIEAKVEETNVPTEDVDSIVKKALVDIDEKTQNLAKIDQATKETGTVLKALMAEREAIIKDEGPSGGQFKARLGEIDGQLFTTLKEQNLNLQAYRALADSQAGGPLGVGVPRFEGNIESLTAEGQPFNASVISLGHENGAVYYLVQDKAGSIASSQIPGNTTVGKAWLKNAEAKGKKYLKVDAWTADKLPDEVQDKLLDRIIETNLEGKTPMRVARKTGVADDVWNRRQDVDYKNRIMAKVRYKHEMEETKWRREEGRMINEEPLDITLNIKNGDSPEVIENIINEASERASKKGVTWTKKEKTELLEQALRLNDSVDQSLQDIDYQDTAYQHKGADMVPILDKYADPSKASNPTMRRIGIYGQQLELSYRQSLLHYMQAANSTLGWLRSNPDKGAELMNHVWNIKKSTDPDILNAAIAHKNLMLDLRNRFNVWLPKVKGEKEYGEPVDYMTKTYDNNLQWDFFKKPLLEVESYTELHDKIKSKIAYNDFHLVRDKAVQYANTKWVDIPGRDRAYLSDHYLKWMGAYTDWSYLPKDQQAMIPEKKWVAFFQPRTANDRLDFALKTDYWEVLQKYLAVTLKGALYNEFLTKTEPLMRTLPHKNTKGTWGHLASEYVKNLGGYGQNAWSDRKWNAIAEQVNTKFSSFKVPMYIPTEFSQWYREALYRGALGPDTALRNLTQTMFTWAEDGTMPVMKGLVNFCYGRVAGTKEYKTFRDTYNLMDEFWTEQMRTMRGSDPSTYRKIQNLNHRLTSLVLTPLRWTEHFNKGVAYFSGLEAARRKGVDFSQAHLIGLTEASRVVPNFEFSEGQWRALQSMGKSQFQYGPATTSPYMKGVGMQMLVPFWSFPIKTAQFIRNGIKEGAMGKDYAKMTRFLLLTGFLAGAPILLAETLGIDASAVWGKGALPISLFPLWYNALSDIYVSAGGNDADPMTKKLAEKRGLEQLWLMAMPQYRWLKKTGAPYETGVTDTKGAWQRLNDKYVRWGQTESPLTNTNYWSELLYVFGWPTQDRREGREWLRMAKGEAAEYSYDKQRAVRRIVELRQAGKNEAANNAMKMARAQGLEITGGDLSMHQRNMNIDAYTLQAKRMPKSMRGEWRKKAEEMKRRYLKKGNRPMWGGERREEEEE